MPLFFNFREGRSFFIFKPGPWTIYHRKKVTVEVCIWTWFSKILSLNMGPIILQQTYSILLGGEMATHERFNLRLSWPRNLLPKERKFLFKYHPNEWTIDTPRRFKTHQRGGKKVERRGKKKEKRREKRCRGKPMSMIISCATSTVSIWPPPRSSVRMALSGLRAPPSLRYSPFAHLISTSFIRLDVVWSVWMSWSALIGSFVWKCGSDPIWMVRAWSAPVAELEA
jgi:hypothetical protein